MAKYYSSTIQKGSTGSDVKEWQKFLNSQGYNLSVDGVFGGNTYNATVNWQMKNGLMNDGIVGKNSWGKAGYSLSSVSAGTGGTGGTEEWSYDDFSYDDFSYDDFEYDDYKESSEVTGSRDALNNHLANKPGEYQSQWQTQLDELMKSILNRDDFSYDLNGDALYQQYKDKFIQQGKLAMGDAIGQASAMTGGYGNSYAQSVGQQAYQGQLDNLNDIVPQLYQMALDKYNMEGQELYNQYGMVADRENMDYGRYRDTVSDWNAERDYLAGRYDSERDFDYSKYVGDRDFAYSQYSSDRALDYDMYSSDRSLAYDEYATDKNLSYQEYRDAIEDAQWLKDYNESVRQFDENLKLAQQEANAKYGNTSANTTGTYNAPNVNKNNTGNTTTGKTPNTSKWSSPSYDNGGLTTAQIKALQNALGVKADGMYGAASKKAAGGLSAVDAYNKYVGGNTTTPKETKNTTQFISSCQTKSEYLARGNNVKQWNEYMESKIASYLRSGRITDQEALYLIQYYGLS